MASRRTDSASSQGGSSRGGSRCNGSDHGGDAYLQERSPIAAQLDHARKDLLDLGLRNPLLNYRLRKARGLALVSPNAAEIFRCLVLEERTLKFLPAVAENDTADDPDAEREQPESQTSADTADVTPDEGPASRQRIVKVRTSHLKEELQRRLVGTYRLGRTAMEEQGVNILFVALGMLSWHESEASEEPRAAPLVLVPITLGRSARGLAFKAEYSGDDVGVNISLIKKLKAEFGVELPSGPSLESADDLLAYFDEVSRAVADQARWSVDVDAAAVGFFSFAKFLMYHDLDPDTCTSEGAGPGSSLLQALLGDGFSMTDDSYVDEADLDKLLDPQEIFHVYDADSTQTAAIIDAKRAPCLVIQGPPGTGKSQTITNLIAEAVGAGSTVLFVAEKRAALEVVKRRLVNAELGDMCLELHSNKANKRAVLDEIKRTLELGQPREPSVRESVRELVSHRDRLNDYCTAMNTFVGNSSTTPYKILGALLRVQRRVNTAALPPSVRDLCADGWTLEDFSRRTGLMAEVGNLLEQMGDPLANPFWGSERQTYLPGDRHLVAEAANLAERSGEGLLDRCTRLSDVLGGPPIDGPRALDEALAVAETLLSKPDLDGIKLRHDAWANDSDRLLELLSMAECLSEVRGKRADQLSPEAWQYDLAALKRIHRVLARIGQGWYRYLFPSYREASRELATLFVGEYPASPKEQLVVVKDIMRAQLIVEELRKAGDVPPESCTT